MYVERLHLVNFRNYREITLDLGEGVNLVIGQNGQGKTNLLEGLFFISRFRGRPFSKITDLVQQGQPYFAVGAVICSSVRKVKISAMFGRGVRKIILDGSEKESVSAVRGILKAVMFSPEDINLISGEPYLRRSFLDSTIELVDPVYVTKKLAYKRALLQRNAVLSKWEIRGNALSAALEPWNIALAECGTYLMEKRRDFLLLAEQVLRKEYAILSGAEQDISISYASSVARQSWEETMAVSKEAFLNSLNKNIQEDVKARCTTIGPHRDDFILMVSGKDARRFMSQGERRTAAYCLRTAEARYIFDKTGEKPVLLLDDVMSELDSGRVKRFARSSFFVEQVFITDTSLDRACEFPISRVIEVERGTARVG